MDREYDQEYPDLDCGICLTVAKHAVVTSCGHMFCNDCLQEHRRSRKDCPHCRAVTSDVAPAYQQRMRIRGLPVKCQFQCGHVEALHRMHKHEEDCDNRPVDCLQCHVMFHKRDLQRHQDNCPRRLVPCPTCPLKIKLDDVEHPLVCPGAVVPCPHGCDQQLYRGDMQKHEDVCKRIIVTCPVPACHFQVSRERMEDHEAQAVLQHIRLLSVLFAER